MKSKEKPVKNAINDKYYQKVGFFKKIRQYFNKKKDLLKSNKELVEELQSIKDIFLGITTYSIIGGFASVLFGNTPSILSFLSVGCLLWLIENKVVEFVTKIISSLNLVRIYK